MNSHKINTSKIRSRIPFANLQTYCTVDTKGCIQTGLIWHPKNQTFFATNQGTSEVLGRTAFGSPNSLHLSNPKNGHQTNRTGQCLAFFSSRLGPNMSISKTEQVSVLRILRFLAESCGVTKLELFQPFPHCK